MEVIAYRYGNHVLIQFDRVVHNLQVVLRNLQGDVLQKVNVNNKDFLLMIIQNDKKEMLKIEVNNHYKVIFKKDLQMR